MLSTSVLSLLRDFFVEALFVIVTNEYALDNDTYSIELVDPTGKISAIVSKSVFEKAGISVGAALELKRLKIISDPKIIILNVENIACVQIFVDTCIVQRN
jgi:hypothetical protein